MKKLFLRLLLLLAILYSKLFAQNSTQTIRGTVMDKQSQSPLPGVNIIVLGSDPLIGASTDENGKFEMKDIKPGRYDVKFSFLGYKEIVLSNILITSGKEAILDVGLEENINKLEEVTVSGTNKSGTNNEMVSVSGRSFSMEEVNRYAGGRSDPSRLAANFAGVSSPNDARNDIVIRGNSPTGVLWRIEGLNIPNPNHFSTIGTTGGPVSALNTNVLKSSDFFTSAFPAEYGNANAGVFDIGFRNGNSEKREHTIQIGALTGVEAMTEGPIRKSKGSSYMIAYRYAFTGVAQKIGIPIGTTATPFYQDISFKINSGNTKIGKFTLFGLGATSNITFDHKKIDTTDLFANPTRDSYFKSNIGLLGLKHFIKVNERSYFNTIIGTTYAGSVYLEDSVTKATGDLTRVVENTTERSYYSLNTSFNSKVSPKLFLKIGAIGELMNLNLIYRDRNYTPYWKEIWDYNDYTELIQGYISGKYNFNDKFTVNAGLHSQYLVLNGSFSLEPRLGMKYALNKKNVLGAGYGMHSQMQPTDVYFFRNINTDGSYSQSNKNIGFTRSQHFVLSYDLYPLDNWRIKTEVYYQYLSAVPVTKNKGSFSMLNSGASFSPNETANLVNTGTGSNYGLELTIEKFFSKGYYFLLTGTLYESKYKGSDNIERNTAFNGKYVYNVLGGKEFKIGKEKRHSINLDIKLTQAGGRYYTPVDLEASKAIGFEILKGDEYAFSERNPDFFRLDIKIGFILNGMKRKVSQVLFFDIQNVTNNKNVFAQRYNPVTNTVNTAYQIGFFPNFGYKIQF